MKHILGKRLGALGLCLCLMLSLLPGTALAADVSGVTVKIGTGGSGYICANGKAITLKAGTDNKTLLYLDSDPSSPLALTDTGGNAYGDTTDGYDLSSVTIYGGKESADLTGSTSITMEGGKVQMIYGGGYASTAAADVTGNTVITLSGGTVNGNVYGGGEGATANADVSGNTTVTISGGTVSGNVYGGGKGSSNSIASVGGKATVTLSGGTVSGWGVYGGGSSHATVGNGTEINITGGTVTGTVYAASTGYNTAVTGAAAVTISGGSVGGVSAFGTDFSAQNTLTVSGDATVGDVALKNPFSSVTIQSGFTGSVAFSVPSGYTVPEAPIATYTDPDPSKLSLTGDGAAAHELYLDGENVKIRTKAAPPTPSGHTHPICGTECSGHNSAHADVTWTAWTSSDSLPDTAGNYYLTQNVTLTNTRGYAWQPVDGVVLCLNCKSITAPAEGNNLAIIQVQEDRTFTLCDCAGAGKLTNAANAPRQGLNNSGGTFNMYGGEITGCDSGNIDGGGVRNYGGIFNLYGGKIHGNQANNNGGGVNAFGGTINMYGGEISGNSTQFGGGVSVFNSGVFRLYGGSVSGNTASKGGGGVSTAGTFAMSGGSITGNTATSAYGGGVSCTDGTFTMSGGSITGNTAASSYGGGIYLLNGTFAMSDGSITDNTARYGNGMCYYTGTFQLTGGVIDANTGGSFKGVLLYTGRQITVTRALPEGASVYIRTWSSPAADSPIAVAKGTDDYTLTRSDLARFTNEPNSIYTLALQDNTIYLEAQHTHSLTKVDGQAADCLNAGWEDYYQCEGCGKYFAEADAAAQIADLDAWKLGEGKLPATGHDWGAWTMKTEPTLTAMGTAERVCGTDSGHKETKPIPVLTDTAVWTPGQRVEPTENREGSQVYTSEGYGAVTVTLPALGHTHAIQKVAGQAADCETDGWKDYYACRCDTYFVDAAGETAIPDLDAWKLGEGKVEATGHAWGTAWAYNATHHWHECGNENCPVSDNSQKDGYAAHTYDNDSDAECNACSFRRTLPDPENPTYSISGIVTENGTPVSGATVTLKRGSAAVATTTTDDQGKYSFSGVAPGSYNVVAEKDGKTMTILVTVTAGDQTEQNLTMPSDNVNSVLKITDNAPTDTAAQADRIVVGGLEKEAEANKPESGTSSTTVTVTMTVESKTEAQAEKAQEIRAQAGAGATLEYIEIKVEKTVEANGSTTTDAISTTANLLEIIIPFDFTGKDKDSVKVYRYHGDKVDTLTATAADGEYITLNEDSITLHVKKFSTYAIGYKETTSEPDPGPSPRPSGSGTTYYAITATAGEGGIIDPSGKVSVRRGSDKTFTITPDEGYVIADVLVDGVSVGTVSEYTFEKVTTAHTIEASFRKADTVADCPRDKICPAGHFTDLDLSAWYHDGVHFCVERELMVGTSETTFAPETDTSRAMIATILWRFQGSKVVNYALQYDDMTEGTWYTEAVRWATSEGIVTGYGNGSFGPNDPITREQLATMLYRYEQKYGDGGFTGSWMFHLDFSDADQVSQWADEAMHWMTMNKIVTGKGGGILDPKGQATRAEVATMLQRYWEK